MLINRFTTITGKKVVLVPYRKEHVLKYHKWMKSEELLRLTGSEPLSLDEEYNMQQSWLMDTNKCTFIVLEKEKYEETKNEIDSMIGDTNLFFANPESTLVAEAEIMIAEPDSRSKGYGFEAMMLMFLYGIEKLNVKQYVVKITMDNNPSLQMFMRMGFVETSRSTIFQEITLEKVINSEWITWIKGCVNPEIKETQE
ncbi:n-acetyltransferase 9 [Holotrichia oblita]|uniref:N-acetyltransferase 9 n=2 Tax=Holotrichia oblita TaxID=644536 RepID=A0ACB9TWM7_HOLOL|nr:n-acetyltransferase 9 [Holotrichia oblita]